VIVYGVPNDWDAAEDGPPDAFFVDVYMPDLT
jgi:hypothetical protein